MSLTERIAQLQAAPDLEALRHAIDALVASQDPAALVPLMRALRCTDSGICDRIVAGLVKFGPVAVQPLIDHLDDHDYAARFQQFRALVQINDPASFDTLVWGLTKDFAPSVRRVAAKGLGQLADPRAIPVLLGVLSDKDWAVRYAALLALEVFRHDPDVRAGLSVVSQDPERIIRIKATALLRD